jgi:anti-sigma regulatory factor (Ser/Thr protein kinase)
MRRSNTNQLREKAERLHQATQACLVNCSRVTRNVVQHAGCPGAIQIGQISDADRFGLRLVVPDKGKGLPRMRKLVDPLNFQSAPDQGVTVPLEIWMRKATA